MAGPKMTTVGLPKDNLKGLKQQTGYIKAVVNVFSKIATSPDSVVVPLLFVSSLVLCLPSPCFLFRLLDPHYGNIFSNSYFPSVSNKALLTTSII